MTNVVWAKSSFNITPVAEEVIDLPAVAGSGFVVSGQYTVDADNALDSMAKFFSLEFLDAGHAIAGFSKIDAGDIAVWALYLNRTRNDLEPEDIYDVQSTGGVPQQFYFYVYLSHNWRVYELPQVRVKTVALATAFPSAATITGSLRFGVIPGTPTIQEKIQKMTPAAAKDIDLRQIIGGDPFSEMFLISTGTPTYIEVKLIGGDGNIDVEIAGNDDALDAHANYLNRVNGAVFDADLKALYFSALLSGNWSGSLRYGAAQAPTIYVLTLAGVILQPTGKVPTAGAASRGLQPGTYVPFGGKNQPNSLGAGTLIASMGNARPTNTIALKKQ